MKVKIPIITNLLDRLRDALEETEPVYLVVSRPDPRIKRAVNPVMRPTGPYRKDPK